MTFATTVIHPSSLNDGRHVFVFGSNLAGKHNGGAAFARQLFGVHCDAVAGLNNYSYLLPTRDEDLKPLSLTKIDCNVIEFLHVAKLHADLTFLVTRIACNLASYTDKDIAPMFKDAPDNCMLPLAWKGLLLPPTS